MYARIRSHEARCLRISLAYHHGPSCALVVCSLGRFLRLRCCQSVLPRCSQSKRPPSALSQALQVVPPHNRSAPPPCRHRTMNRHHGWLRGARLVVWGPVGAHSPRPARPGLRVVPQVAASTTISLLSSRPARILARLRTCGTTGTPMCRAKCRKGVVGEVWIMAIDTK